MTQQKIEGKFYPLQHEEWLRACRELTPAQRDVLYYIRTLDPYGDGMELSVSEIARQLSTENKEVHRSTVSRALKKTFFSHRNKRDRHATRAIATQHARSPRNKQSLKRRQSKNPATLRLIKTLKTLSQRARESLFWSFVGRRPRTSTHH